RVRIGNEVGGEGSKQAQQREFRRAVQVAKISPTSHDHRNATRVRPQRAYAQSVTKVRVHDPDTLVSTERHAPPSGPEKIQTGEGTISKHRRGAGKSQVSQAGTGVEKGQVRLELSTIETFQ